MKNMVFAGFLLVFCALLAFGCTKQETAALNVNDVGPDPAAFVGTITVAGITAGYAPQDPNLFGIMDMKELQCQSPNCNKLIIPVRFSGQRPAIGDEVRIRGSFMETGRGFLFTAETVKVVKNHKLGG